MMSIITIDNKKQEKFLRKKTLTVDFAREDKRELRELVKKMRRIMREANGIGLSANQIGIAKRLFVAELPDAHGRIKFYAIANPEIVKESSEKVAEEEGCLSVPEQFGQVERFYRVTLSGQNISGKKLKIKAWGLLARVFQHETDHLNGKLFLDRTQKTYTVPESERLREKYNK